MSFEIESRENLVLITFPNLDEDGRSLSQEVTALLTGPARLLAFDFSPLTKIEFHLLRDMEPVLHAIRASGRPYAVCCGDPAIQAVLETAGLLAGADLFAGRNELLRFMGRQTAQPKPHAPSRKRSTWAGLFRVRYDFHTLGLGAIILLLLVGGIQNLALSCNVRRLSKRVEELALLAQSPDHDSSPSPSTELVRESDPASVVRPEAARTVISYGEASRALRRSAQSFLDAQHAFYRQNSRFASSLSELGWTAEPKIEVSDQRSLPTGELVHLLLARDIAGGLRLKWDVDVRSGFRPVR